jgi:acyl-CoA thioesterase-2
MTNGSDAVTDPHERATSLVDLLELERVDRDLWVGAPGPPAGPPGRQHLFGGLVAAQALRAAINTVDADRAPHSMHGYFLRPGDGSQRVVFQSYRDRDGRSFSARRVVALQEGEVIFSLAASFHVEEESGEYRPPMPDHAGTPDDIEPHPVMGGPSGMFDLRAVPVPGVEAEMTMPSRYWARSEEPLPDDPTVHACALVYLSDLGSGFGRVEVPGLAKVGTSLDHTVWFHAPVRADEWLLLDLWPLRASRAIGTYGGTIHTLDGRCGAVLTQECLLRTTGPAAIGEHWRAPAE